MHNSLPFTSFLDIFGSSENFATFTLTKPLLSSSLLTVYRLTSINYLYHYLWLIATFLPLILNIFITLLSVGLLLTFSQFKILISLTSFPSVLASVWLLVDVHVFACVFAFCLSSHNSKYSYLSLHSSLSLRLSGYLLMSTCLLACCAFCCVLSSLLNV